MSELLSCLDIRRVAVLGLAVSLAIAGYRLLSIKAKELPKAEQKAAQQLGGLERLQDLKDYIMCDTLNYCDKKDSGHAERSRRNQPNHDDWWRRQK